MLSGSPSKQCPELWQHYNEVETKVWEGRMVVWRGKTDSAVRIWWMAQFHLFRRLLGGRAGGGGGYLCFWLPLIKQEMGLLGFPRGKFRQVASWEWSPFLSLFLGPNDECPFGVFLGSSGGCAHSSKPEIVVESCFFLSLNLWTGIWLARELDATLRNFCLPGRDEF